VHHVCTKSCSASPSVRSGNSIPFHPLILFPILSAARAAPPPAGNAPERRYHCEVEKTPGKPRFVQDDASTGPLFPLLVLALFPFVFLFSPPSSFLLPALAPQAGDEMHLLHIQYVLRCACLLACSCLLLYLAASAVGLSWRTAELMLGVCPPAMSVDRIYLPYCAVHAVPGFT
jgi:hypothetical protein